MRGQPTERATDMRETDKPSPQEQALNAGLDLVYQALAKGRIETEEMPEKLLEDTDIKPCGPLRQ